MLNPGTKVDRYVVEQRIGRGGMADVYAVRHRVLHTRHALKVLRDGDAGSVERAAREGRAQAALEHPNVVPVRDVFEVLGRPALLMPWVNGPSLEQLLAHRSLTIEEIGPIFRGVVEGVAWVHHKGLVHRDLKPGNVLIELRDDGVVARVSDFGLVEATATGTPGARSRTGFVGTPGYAAPEQLRGRDDLDVRVDVWGLGAVLYVMLCGAMPWDAESVETVLRGHRAAPPPVASLACDVPPGWCALVDELLAFERADRPATAARVLDTLDRLGTTAHVLPIASELATAAARIASEAVDRESLGMAATEMALSSDVDVADDPMWGTLSRPSSNLPRPIDRFVGRDEDQQALVAAVEARDLVVTLVGTAGTGKTRLAIEVARRAGKRPGGTWFCDLTDALDDDAVCDAVSRALGLRLDAGAGPRAVGAALRALGDCLILFDNAEQCARPLAGLIDGWRDVSDALGVVVTSRVPLGVRGEWVYRLDPLGTRGDASEPAPAVTLFVERARAVDARFRVDDDDMPALHALVAALDGLPLAIELAASRVRVLSLEALSRQLDARFTLLADPRRDQTRRSATLRGAIDVSWHLLEPWEKLALAQCSVFVDGFDLEAAHAVLDLADWPAAPAVFDVMSALVDASLVQVDRSSDTARFALLASIREYAAERLAAPDDLRGPDGAVLGGPVAEARARRRHAAWFGRAGDVVAPTDGHMRELDADVLRFDADRANLLAAVGRAADVGDADLAARAALMVSALARALGPFAMGIQALDRALASGSVVPALHIRALSELGTLLRWTNDPRAVPILLDLRELAHQLQDARAERLALRGLAFASAAVDRHEEAAAWLDQARAVDGGIIDAHDAALLEFAVGVCHMSGRRHDLAEPCFDAALRRARLSGDRLFEATVMYYRCNLRFQQARFDECTRDARAVIALSPERSHRGNEAWALRLMGIAARLVDRPAEAVRALSRSVQIHRRINPASLDGTVMHLALACLESGDVAGARQWMHRHPPAPPNENTAAWVARSWGVMGLVAACDGDEVAASSAFANAGDALALTHVDRARVQVLAYHARAAHALGDAAHARWLIDEATSLVGTLQLDAQLVETIELERARRIVATEVRPS